MKKEIKFINYRKYIFVLGALILSIIVLNIMYRTNTVFATSYSTNIYPYLTKTIGALWGILPFSLFEFLIIGTIIFVLFFLTKLIVILVKNHSKSTIFYFWYHLKKYLLNLSVIGLSALLVYCMTCGINYYRLPFSVSANFKTSEHSIEDLEELCRILAKDLNEYSQYIETDENGIFTVDNIDMQKEASIAMEALSVKYPCLTDFYPNAKPIVFSKFMSYTGISGIYSPFTIEANYNNHMPDLEKPMTICHELSHLSGFMLEDEANFISYLGCIESDNYAFKYSGTYVAFIYASNAYYSNGDIDVYNDIMDSLNKQVHRDMKHHTDYWYSDEVNIEIEIGGEDITMSDVSSQINDNYLQMNGQDDGVKSYDHVTDLLLSYYFTK